VEHNSTEFLNLAIVDDDPATWEVLAYLFESAGFQVHTFSDSDAFLLTAGHIKPQCVILDVGVSPRSGLDVLAVLGGRNYPVPVFLTSRRADIPMAVAAIKAGAYDLIEKPVNGQSVIERVQVAVRQGKPTGGITSRLKLALSAGLTARETEVLQHIVGGASNKAAGRLLTISPRTVEVHRARVMEKLGARNTADLVRIVLS